MRGICHLNDKMGIGSEMQKTKDQSLPELKYFSPYNKCKSIIYGFTSNLI